MKKELRKDIEWKGRMKKKVFQDILFEKLTVRNAHLSNSSFIKVHFKNCYLGFNSEYSDCTFKDCKFYGKYASLGSPANYRNCKFEDCHFTGLDLFAGQHFHDCKFTGVMKNHILNSNHPKVENSETSFSKCDFSGMLFDNVNLYGNVFKDCKLPNEGIRIFDNSDDRLLQRAEELCLKRQGIDCDESLIIFSRMRNGVNPIILDELFLDAFLKNEVAKEVFNQIVAGHELTC